MLPRSLIKVLFRENNIIYPQYSCSGAQTVQEISGVKWERQTNGNLGSSQGGNSGRAESIDSTSLTKQRVAIPHLHKS